MALLLPQQCTDNTRAEDPRFCCGIYPEPITTTVHVLHTDGSDTMIGSLRTVQYLYWPNEGYNIAIVSVRLNDKANSVNLKYYPVRREFSVRAHRSVTP